MPKNISDKIPSSVWLQNMTWEEVKTTIDESCKTIILPFGSTEQHGPHLPVGTDTMVAMTLAQDAAAKTNVPVAPPLWFGWSPHHMVLPGTITIRPEILAEMAFDIISSLIYRRYAVLRSFKPRGDETDDPEIRWNNRRALQGIP